MALSHICRQLASGLEQMRAALTPVSSHGDTSRPPGRSNLSGSRPPLNLRMLDHLIQIEDEVSDLILQVCDAAQVPLPPGHVAQQCRWFSEHIALLYAHPEPDVIEQGFAVLAEHVGHILHPAPVMPRCLSVDQARLMANALGYQIPVEKIQAWIRQGGSKRSGAELQEWLISGSYS